MKINKKALLIALKECLPLLSMALTLLISYNLFVYVATHCSVLAFCVFAAITIFLFLLFFMYYHALPDNSESS